MSKFRFAIKVLLVLEERYSTAIFVTFRSRPWRKYDEMDRLWDGATNVET